MDKGKGDKAKVKLKVTVKGDPDARKEALRVAKSGLRGK